MATLIGILFVKVGFPETNIVVIYIFAVLLVARFTKGYFYGILSSVVCLLCFNYFFTAPYRTLAVIMIDRKVSEQEISSNKKLIHFMIENISLALERIEITIERVRDRQRMERERERANLLRAISHDLRTPLSGIMGSAEMLMDMTEKDDNRQKLLKGIYQDADWLKSLVENILSLTRLQDGKILVHKEMEALEEVIACAVAHIEKNYPDREIQVEIPEDFRMVPMDAKLIEQVIYTSRTRAADVRKGIGLGLTICETVVNAHGGTITGRNREDGKGAEFIFTLPL